MWLVADKGSRKWVYQAQAYETDKVWRMFHAAFRKLIKMWPRCPRRPWHYYILFVASYVH